MKYAFAFGLLSFCGAACADALTSGASLLATTFLSGGGAGLLGILGSKLMGGKPAAPAAPKAAVMPVSDDKAVEEARRRQIAAIQARSGRASTILSDGGAKLGG